MDSASAKSSIAFKEENKKTFIIIRIDIHIDSILIYKLCFLSKLFGKIESSNSVYAFVTDGVLDAIYKQKQIVLKAKFVGDGLIQCS